jgi:hypothetical protein
LPNFHCENPSCPYYLKTGLSEYAPGDKVVNIETGDVGTVQATACSECGNDVVFDGVFDWAEAPIPGIDIEGEPKKIKRGRLSLLANSKKITLDDIPFILCLFFILLLIANIINDFK